MCSCMMCVLGTVSLCTASDKRVCLPRTNNAFLLKKKKSIPSSYSVWPQYLSPPTQITYNIVAVLRTEKAPHMTASLVSHHQLSVTVVTFCCVPVNVKHIFTPNY